jgi:hypothetical protein
MAHVDEKSWYASKAVWGAIIAGICALLALIGKALTPEEQSILTDRIVELAVAIVGLLGAALAVYGRLKATTRLTK